MRALGVLVLLAGVAAAEPHMRKGPYLQNVAPTSITVMWELDEPAAARLVLDGPGGPWTIDVPASRIAEVPLTGLAPASRYRYRVELAGVTWAGELATAPAVGADVPLAFVVIGDSRDGAEPHRRVLDQLARETPDFVLGTGDMVDDGKREDQWQQFFDIERDLMRDNVLFPALGNHDRQGRGRTADTYRAYFALPDNGGDGQRYYAFTFGASRFVVLDSNQASFALADQTAWLEAELAAARRSLRHVFVVMHHPMFSIALHGGARELRERWTPLFERYRVTAVFSGHDHAYERAEHAGIHYFVSGGGGAPLYGKRPKPSPADLEAVQTFERALHYLRVTVAGDRIEVTAIRADGTTIETTRWTDGGGPIAEPIVAPIAVQPPVIGPAGAPAEAPESGPAILPIALAVLAGVLVAAVVVVRTLRA